LRFASGRGGTGHRDIIVPQENVKKAIRARARSLGFDAAGFAPAATLPYHRQGLADYVADGRHGDMAWMAETADRRRDPRALWADARSVIVLGVNYGPGEDPLRRLARVDRASISVYAHGRDYHDLVKKRLKALARWLVETRSCEVKVFVDTAPVMEKPLATLAGLGWQGKHTNVVSRRFGSWLFLGEVFTTLEIEPDPPAEDLCGSCRRCLDACPTDALRQPYRIDARACISYLTIEHKGPIPDRYRAAMGNRVFGCDDCLAVCPWNKFATASSEPALQPRAHTLMPRLADLVALDDAGFRAVFSGSPVKRTGRDRFVRNVLIAIGNSGDPALAATVERLLDDPSDLVREAARWALARLEGAHSGGAAA
jgi:epoxyqueuosine reductase